MLERLLQMLHQPVHGYPLGIHLLTCAAILAACWAFALAFTSPSDHAHES